jgi:hypothetical protein
MRGRTATGVQAYSIREWAWQDPAGRVEEAIERVTDLARDATGPALNECEDVTQMLTRLAGTVGIDPVAALVLPPATPPVQMAGTISSQVFDFASYHGQHVKGTPYTWRHGWIPLSGVSRLVSQSRADIGNLSRKIHSMIHGKEGKHAALKAKMQAPAAPAKPSIQPQANMVDALTPRASSISGQVSAGNNAFAAARAAATGVTLPSTAGDKITADPARIKQFHDAMDALAPATTDEQRIARAEAAVAAAMIDSKHDKQLNKMLAKVTAANEGLTGHIEDVEKEEAKDARKKLAVEGSVALGGAVLAAIEAKMGVPDLVAIATALGPMAVQLLVEFKNRL